MSTDEAKDIRETLREFISDGKTHELRGFIEEKLNELDDSSWQIRKKVAESLMEISSSLDDLNQLRQNFRLLSANFSQFRVHAAPFAGAGALPERVVLRLAMPDKIELHAFQYLLSMRTPLEGV